ncbi:hypothetical protein GCM10028807_29430 [Spirosoma daeguense]
MKISKELIEKYHNGQCTLAEKRAVEAWLFDEEPSIESPLSFPDGESKAKLQEEMWNEIASILPQNKKSGILVTFKPLWQQAAAVLLVSLFGAALFYLIDQRANNEIIVVNNLSGTANKQLHESAYSLSVGPKSNVQINNETGRIEFCGAMMINPKRDIELTIQGICARPDKASEKMILKKGQNYIALHYGNTANVDEVLILPQSSLTGLPPLMQRNLMMQFNI